MREQHIDNINIVLNHKKLRIGEDFWLKDLIYKKCNCCKTLGNISQGTSLSSHVTSFISGIVDRRLTISDQCFRLSSP